MCRPSPALGTPLPPALEAPPTPALGTLRPEAR